MKLTKDGAANESALHWLRRLEAVLAAEDAQPAVVVADELELSKSLAAPVAELRLAACAGHVITAGTPLDVELPTTKNTPPTACTRVSSNHGPPFTVMD